MLSKSRYNVYLEDTGIEGDFAELKILFGVIMVVCAIYGVMNIRSGEYRRRRLPLWLMAVIFIIAILIRLLRGGSIRL
jgi:cell division protein FtsW (lipid II flippase)